MILNQLTLGSLKIPSKVTAKTTRDIIKYNSHDLLFHYNKILQQILQNTKYNFVQ